MITLELEGRQPSVESLATNLEQRKKDSSFQKQFERLTLVKDMFLQLQSRTGTRKDECLAAYKNYVDNFEKWLSNILNNLQSGNLLSTDILVFEENLTVSLVTYFLVRFCGHTL